MTKPPSNLEHSPVETQPKSIAQKLAFGLGMLAFFSAVSSVGWILALGLIGYTGFLGPNFTVGKVLVIAICAIGYPVLLGVLSLSYADHPKTSTGRIVVWLSLPLLLCLGYVLIRILFTS